MLDEVRYLRVMKLIIATSRGRLCSIVQVCEFNYLFHHDRVALEVWIIDKPLLRDSVLQAGVDVLPDKVTARQMKLLKEFIHI